MHLFFSFFVDLCILRMGKSIFGCHSRTIAEQRRPFGSSLALTQMIFIHSPWILGELPCSMVPWCGITLHPTQRTSCESPWIFGLVLEDTTIRTGNWKGCSTTTAGVRSFCEIQVEGACMAHGGEGRLEEMKHQAPGRSSQEE